ncbi:MAG: S9 family peptidase [Rickettsiales bacterium]|nr:MAG: S9 family peptidase [Rickettsiales bacterium]
MIQDKLIEREILFGNPDKIAVRISNNGKYISFLAPKDGVLNIWVAPTENITQAKAITNEQGRGIRVYHWAKDSLHIIYAQDKNGDENWQLCSVNIETFERLELTSSNVRSSILKMSNKYPDEMLVLINDKVPTHFNIYKINVKTKQSELVYDNIDQYSSFIADDDFKIRVAYKMTPLGVGEIYLFKDKELKQAKLFQQIAIEDMLTTNVLHISSDGSKLFMTDSTNSNTSALIEIDLNSKSRKILYIDEKSDIDDYLVDPKTKLVQGVATNHLRKQWQILDNDIQKDFIYLKNIEDGDLEITSRSYDNMLWVVVYLKSDEPNQYYLYDRVKNKVSFLFSSNIKQEGLPFAKMHPIIIKSRDGLDLISYLTLPRWLDNGKGIPKHPVPLIVCVHGGPNARDIWGFNANTQWLANRGYAVLSVNFRGSVGMGKNFINAGDGEWARKMQDDLEDGVIWCIENNITKKETVAIMGGSYGGYATLVGMTMTPDLYVAGIDIVGPSNLQTLVESIPPYWKPQIAHLYKMIGASPENEEGRAYLKERSPLNYAANIKKPLLIVQGANDPRVKQAESDQIVKAMKQLSIPVVYLLYPDEGHGLAKPENRLSMYAHAEIFLANFAGGRYIPHNNDFLNSSVQVKEGEDINWTKTKNNSEIV